MNCARYWVKIRVIYPVKLTSLPTCLTRTAKKKGGGASIGTMPPLASQSGGIVLRLLGGGAPPKTPVSARLRARLPASYFCLLFE